MAFTDTKQNALATAIFSEYALDETRNNAYISLACVLYFQMHILYLEK